MDQELAHEVVGFRGMADEAFDALTDCFRGDRLRAAGMGIGVAFVLAGAAGTTTAVLLLRNALGLAAMVGVLAGFMVYAGLLVTHGALARMAMAKRHGIVVGPGPAFAFAAQRSHILIGLPLFTLVVALGAGSLGGYLGAAAAASPLGSALAPLALVLLFALNVVLVGVVLVSHSLTAPCVACLDPSFATVASRLIRVIRERLGAFLAYQAAAAVVGVPLVLFATGLFISAFQPAFQATAGGRAKALIDRRAGGPAPSAAAVPSGTPSLAPREEGRDWTARLRSWAGWAADLGAAPLLSAAAVLALLLGVFPLIYAGSVESAVYVGLTGDRFLAAPQPPGAAEARPGRHPPIVHCWRCDAISRFGAPACMKCGAPLVVCPYCFATNERERVVCSSCGRTIAPELEPEGFGAADEEGTGQGTDRRLPS